MTYRPDIDGLRAIAVLAVMFYHFGVSGFDGGFVGVDIFFVISGFLITGIITREIKENRFSLSGFYERRIRRIFPALFAVLIFTTLVGGILLLPDTYQDYGATLLTATLFVSNIFFYLSAGYFDSAAEMKPLLHTWSLSVEEQFYIFFPPLLMIIAARFKGKFLLIIAALALISFILGLWQVTTDQNAAFYLIHTRFWELALGALLVFMRPNAFNKFTNEVLSITGLLFIIFSIIYLNEHLTFPGAYALLPCVGTAILIYSATHTKTGALLSYKPMVGIGLISYSLYLWHWPLYVFFNYLTLRAPDVSEIIFLTTVSFILSALSWRYIERPFRIKPSKISRGHVFLYAIIAIFISIFVANILYSTKGLPQRLPANIQTYFTDTYKYDVLEKLDMYTCLGDKDLNPDSLKKAKNGQFCTLGIPQENKAPNFILWGDSHAETLRAGFEKIALERKQYGVFAGYGSCPPLLNLRRYDDVTTECIDYNQAVLDFIDRNNIKHVILSARWASVTSGRRYKTDADYRIILHSSKDLAQNKHVFATKLNETIAVLKSRNIRITLIAGIPEVGHNVFLYHIRTQHMNFANLDINSLRPTTVEYLSRNQDSLNSFQSLEGVQVIYPHEFLCTNNACNILNNDTPLYRDNDHLSRYGSEFLSPYLKSAFDED